VSIVTAGPAPQTAATPAGASSGPPIRAATSAWQLGLACAALFALALAPRLIGLEQHLTADDQDWVRRVSRFGLAVQRGSWRETYQTEHPGVTVMWLAALAFGPERSAELAARAGDLTQLEKSPAYLGALFDARRALALVSAGLTVLLSLLTWRL